MGKKKHAIPGPKAPSSKVAIPSCSGYGPLDGIRPSWRLSKLCVPSLPDFAFPQDASTLEYIRSKLANFETMTLGELRNDRRNNRYAVYTLENRLIPPVLDYMSQQGFEEVHRFRLAGAERVYAFSLEHGIFDLVWWDPQHKIYPVEKR